jgi:GxxExxY protein
MEINELTEIVIGCAIEVHRKLNPKLLESTYQEYLFYKLKTHGLYPKKE